MRRARRSARWSLAAALVCGAVVATTGLAPSGAQEPPPGDTTSTTEIPSPPGPTPDTTAPAHATDPSAPATTTPPSTDEPSTVPDPTPSTTTDAAAATGGSTESTPAPAGVAAAADGTGLVLDLAPGALVVDGQALAVTASGVGSVMYAQVAQCEVGDAPLHQRCEYEYGPYETVDGGLRLTIRLDAVLTITNDVDGSRRSVDCRSQACEVVVSYMPASGATATLSAPLPFDPDAPLAPPATATLAPEGPYVDGHPVTVRAEGLVWAPDVQIVQCAAGATSMTTCDYGTATSAFLDADQSSVELTLRLLAVIDTSGGEVDCRTAGACVLVVSAGYDIDPRQSVAIPLEFDPTTEVVPPTLTISPADGLVHGQVVTATGTGYVDRFVQFSQCATDAEGADSCVWIQGWAEPDATGSFTAHVAVRAYVSTPTGEVDCREPSAPCELVASTSSPTSGRAGRAPLHFAADGPMPAPPSIVVTPSSDLPVEATVIVTGTGFGTDGEGAELSVCRTDTSVCDESARQWLEPGRDGSISAQVAVGASFAAWDGSQVDCRLEPGCTIVVRDGYDGRRAIAPISFGAPPTMADRYRLPVFDEVDVTSGVVYRSTTDAAGRAVDLRLSVYEPAGDTVERRPAIVWLDGGWFGPSPRSMSADADAFARRGYVAITMGYRSRPGLQCCPTDDIEGVTAAVDDATDDAHAGVRWLREHADEYGIDPDAIAVAGAQGGGAAAFGLAHVVDAPVAAAVPVVSVGFGRPDAGEPPFLAIHERRSTVAPAHLSEWACTRARSLGTTCATAVIDTAYDGPLAPASRAIAVEASAFLADVVLAPLGYTEPSGRDWGGATGGGSTGGPGIDPLGTVVPGAGVVAAVATSAAIGRLPATGATVGTLIALALVLVTVGAGALAMRRARLGRPDQPGRLHRLDRLERLGRTALADRGAVRMWVAAGAAVVLVVAGFAVTSALGSDEETDETAGGPTADESAADAATDDQQGHDDHGSMDHDEHASMDHGSPDHDDLGHTAIDGADDHPDHPQGSSPTSGHRHSRTGGGSTTHAHTPGAPADAHDHGTGDTGSGDHSHTDPSTPPHEHPDPGTPPHTHPDPDPTDPDPPTGFDPAWTPEQVAYAEQLIADTRAQLVRYDTLAILPLTGYQWIRDGQRVEEYQHWINVSRIADPRRLDAAYPESLVLRTTADGPKLEAAMYMLSLGYSLSNIPADIAWLPGWHIHDNLCFENGYELVGVTVNGVCERGYVLPTPPMIHVWREPTECGWFAGVDEFGLQCDHEH